MSRSQPHPLALFSLVPLNTRAHEVVADPSNAHLASRLPDDTLVLDIGHVRSKSPLDTATTLATLGRDADILVSGSIISRVQCSFEIDPTTNVVMFYDRSHSQSSQVFGKNAIQFGYGRPRKVVVNNDTNTKIGMGGQKRNLVIFELRWHYDPIPVMQMVQNRQHHALEVHPRIARTINEIYETDETDGISAEDPTQPTQMVTRPHTGEPKSSEIRYRPVGELLGEGAFGKVERVVDVDTGKLMALKLVKHPSRELEKTALKREIEVLSGLSHPYIVDYINFDDNDPVVCKIFMGLKEGTLKSLLETGGPSVDPKVIAGIVLNHMLQAIDFLATKKIIHRDIKPENVLYVVKSSNYVFQLGDFGLCNNRPIADTYVGTPVYMAPEIYYGRRQTHKVDVWSLFVTMLWTLDVNDFRQALNKWKKYEQICKAVLSRVNEVEDVIRPMARIDLTERASAAQMLVKCFNGNGLSTPRHLVPALEPVQLCNTTRAKAFLVPPSRPSPPTRYKALQKPYRVGKITRDLDSPLRLPNQASAPKKRLRLRVLGDAANWPVIPGMWPEV
ncbi:kinase-like domain-containing protein [Xylaria sp. FL0043]|nr:kinase-like domain-containing protein [Xylaria sp. FL0043]